MAGTLGRGEKEREEKMWDKKAEKVFRRGIIPTDSLFSINYASFPFHYHCYAYKFN